MQTDTDPPISPAERLGIEERQAAFNATLMGEDHLGMIIRAHIHIEHELAGFLEAVTPRPESLKPLRLDYDGRVNLAVALGLPPDYLAMLSCVGKLRNQFAHRLNAQLGSQEANNLERAMDEHAEVAKSALASTDRKLGHATRKWSDLEPKDQLILMLSTIWSAIAVANVKATQLRNLAD
jgi:hypothetical protein